MKSWRKLGVMGGGLRRGVFASSLVPHEIDQLVL